MTTRYELFNEITFQAYCKAAIDKAVLKERIKKAAREQWELPFSELSESALPSLGGEDMQIAEISKETVSIPVCKDKSQSVQISDPKLGQALSFLPPKDRTILLLYYFCDMSDGQIAKQMRLSRATVQRRRRNAEARLRRLLEDSR